MTDLSQGMLDGLQEACEAIRLDGAVDPVVPADVYSISINGEARFMGEKGACQRAARANVVELQDEGDSMLILHGMYLFGFAYINDGHLIAVLSAADERGDWAERDCGPVQDPTVGIGATGWNGLQMAGDADGFTPEMSRAHAITGTRGRRYVN